MYFGLTEYLVITVFQHHPAQLELKLIPKRMSELSTVWVMLSVLSHHHHHHHHHHPHRV